MKLYKKPRNVFFVLSILIIGCCCLLKDRDLTNILIGVSASTVIITIQSHIAMRVEESKLLIKKLRKMYDDCLKIYFDFDHSSIEYFLFDFDDNYYEYKKTLEEIFGINSELSNITGLSIKTKNKLKEITDKFSTLQLDLHYIFDRYDEQTLKMKVIYFMEFFRIIKDFNFRNMSKIISRVGNYVDSNEFYKHEYDEYLEREVKKYEMENSIKVFNQKLLEKHSTEYKAVGRDFEDNLNQKKSFILNNKKNRTIV